MKLPLIGHIAVWITLLPAFVGVWQYRSLDRPMKLFVIFCVLGAINVVSEVVLSRMNVTNFFLSDIYMLLAVPFFGVVYYHSVMASSVRVFLKYCSVLFVLIGAIQELFFADHSELNSVLAMITAIFLVIMSIVTFNAFVRSTSSDLRREPIFWILTGTIVYYAGTFAVMGLGRNLMDLSLSLFVVAWYVNWILIIASMLMYSRGLLCKSQA